MKSNDISEEAFDKEFVKIVDMNTVRRCGKCDLCCKALEVFDLTPKKPMGHRCPHQRKVGTGCEIYKKRPHTCKVFYCAWRAGDLAGVHLPDKLYPAECGFVISYDPTLNPIFATVFLDPDRPNAWAMYKPELEDMAEKNNIGVVIGGGDSATHVVSPKRHWFSRVDWPGFFNGYHVGLPSIEFHNGRPNGEFSWLSAASKTLSASPQSTRKG